MNLSSAMVCEKGNPKRWHRMLYPLIKIRIGKFKNSMYSYIYMSVYMYLDTNIDKRKGIWKEIKIQNGGSL